MEAADRTRYLEERSTAIDLAFERFELLVQQRKDLLTQEGKMRERKVLKRKIKRACRADPQHKHMLSSLRDDEAKVQREVESLLVATQPEVTAPIEPTHLLGRKREIYFLQIQNQRVRREREMLAEITRELDASLERLEAMWYRITTPWWFRLVSYIGMVSVSALVLLGGAYVLMRSED